MPRVTTTRSKRAIESPKYSQKFPVKTIFPLCMSHAPSQHRYNDWLVPGRCHRYTSAWFSLIRQRPVATRPWSALLFSERPGVGPEHSCHTVARRRYRLGVQASRSNCKTQRRLKAQRSGQASGVLGCSNYSSIMGNTVEPKNFTTAPPGA